MPEVWECAKSSCVGHESHNQAMAIQRVGNWFNRSNISPSSKNHKFILVATDYFTKWVEAIPLKNVTSKEMIEFVKEHIIYRFGVPQTITTDQGTMFILDEFEEFATGMGIKLLNFSPYYASNKGV